MTLPALSQSKMLEILNANGFDALSDRYWETEGIDRIIMGNGRMNFTLKLKKFYFFPEVVKRCEMLGITYDNIPDHIKDEYKTCFNKYTEFTGMIAEEAEPLDEDNDEEESK